MTAKNCQKYIEKCGGFTLPEVIVSIGIIVTVIVSAMGILVTVIKTNAENLNTLTAYGLAQEGLEASRFIRDSNFLLGLNFNGTKPGEQLGNNFWQGNAVLSSKYVLIRNANILTDCTKINLIDCMPFKLEVADENNLKVKKTTDGVFVQGSEISGIDTQFERVLYLKADSDPDDGVAEYQVISEVSWPGQNPENKNSVMLTTVFSDWQFKSNAQNQE